MADLTANHRNSIEQTKRCVPTLQSAHCVAYCPLSRRGVVGVIHYILMRACVRACVCACVPSTVVIRLAHDEASGTVGKAWQAKFDIAERRFEQVTSTLERQNTALRQGHPLPSPSPSSSGGQGAGSGGHASSATDRAAVRKMSALLKASETKSSDTLARVQKVSDACPLDPLSPVLAYHAGSTACAAWRGVMCGVV